MASLQCSVCKNAIRFHGEPVGVEFVMILKEDWKKIVTSEFRPEAKTYISGTRYPKLFRTDTIEEDFPGMVKKFWKCQECGSLFFFDELKNVSESYVMSREEVCEDFQLQQEYIVFDDYLWDEIMESGLPVSKIEEKFKIFARAKMTKNYIIFKYDKDLFIESYIRFVE